MKQAEDIQWLEFDNFAKYPHLDCRFFLKKGGGSQGEFASLNVGAEVGDNIDFVKENRGRIALLMGADRIIFPKQVHETTVIEITKDNQDILHEADALYTKQKNVAIGVMTADCQAAIFYCPKKNIVAVAHAGWKGLVKNIYKQVLDVLKNKEQVDVSSLQVGICPSLGPCHSEFIHYKQEIPSCLWKYKLENNHFDLWAIARDQLLLEGVKEENLEIMKKCTYENPEDYYSFRRDKKTGRHATVVYLKN